MICKQIWAINKNINTNFQDNIIYIFKFFIILLIDIFGFYIEIW